MEISSIGGLYELGMEDSGFNNQWQMNFIDDLSLPPLATALGDNIQQHPFSQTFSHKTSMVDTSPPSIVRPTKQLKPNTFDTIMSPQPVFAPNILSFVNSNLINQMEVVKPKEESINTFPSDVLVSQSCSPNQNYVFKAGHKRVSTTTRHAQSQEHIIAERKRREKLSQRFIALSAIIPGLKKTDKASVLGDAIKYLKQLQERVKILEEETRKKTMESVVIVKKSQLFVEGDNSYSDESLCEGPFDEALPEIEARFCDKHVLIRIHCEKRKGVLEKIVSEIEKLNLSVINSSVLTFASSALDLTIIAKMDTEFNMSVKDLVKKLRSAFMVFM